jgi:hypothetical protein
MTIFTFQLTKATLQAALTAMEHHNRTASQDLILQISVDIVPDGISCEAYNPKLDIVVVQNVAHETVVPPMFQRAFGNGELEP